MKDFPSEDQPYIRQLFLVNILRFFLCFFVPHNNLYHFLLLIIIYYYYYNTPIAHKKLKKNYDE